MAFFCKTFLWKTAREEERGGTPRPVSFTASCPSYYPNPAHLPNHLAQPADHPAPPTGHLPTTCPQRADRLRRDPPTFPPPAPREADRPQGAGCPTRLAAFRSPPISVQNEFRAPVMSRLGFPPVASPVAGLVTLLLVAATAGGVRGSGGNAALSRKLAAGGSGNSGAAAAQPAAELVKDSPHASAEGDGLVVKDSAPSASGGEVDEQIPPLQLIIAEEGRAEGAVCLDGTAPGCAYRAHTRLGSTDHALSPAEMVDARNGTMNGMLSCNRTVNPGEASTVNPGEASTVNPGEASTVNPGEASTVNPGEASTVNPGEASTVNPGEASTVNPGFFNWSAVYFICQLSRADTALHPPVSPPPCLVSPCPRVPASVSPCPRVPASPPPCFYNWNAVYFIYCDGGSFAGDQDEPVHFNVSQSPAPLASPPIRSSAPPPLCLSASLPLRLSNLCLSLPPPPSTNLSLFSSSSSPPLPIGFASSSPPLRLSASPTSSRFCLPTSATPPLRLSAPFSVSPPPCPRSPPSCPSYPPLCPSPFPPAPLTLPSAPSSFPPAPPTLPSAPSSFPPAPLTLPAAPRPFRPAPRSPSPGHSAVRAGKASGGPVASAPSGQDGARSSRHLRRLKSQHLLDRMGLAQADRVRGEGVRREGRGDEKGWSESGEDGSNSRGAVARQSPEADSALRHGRKASGLLKAVSSRFPSPLSPPPCVHFCSPVPMYPCARFPSAGAVAAPLLRVVVSGTSAGGVSALLHCDQVKDTLTTASPSMHVRCLADASMFLDVPDVNNTRRVANFFAEVKDMHNLTDSLPAACLNERESEKHHECFMTNHLLQYVSTPLFLINSNYDKIAVNYRKSVAAAAAPLLHTNPPSSTSLSPTPPHSTPANAVFLFSCFQHGSIHSDVPWTVRTAKGVECALLQQYAKAGVCFAAAVRIGRQECALLQQYA
ncbi:unnamed protein product [Closterium sp. NIES-64]|nr:unnamed protein product [Closterium sp. NIES-64]